MGSEEGGGSLIPSGGSPSLSASVACFDFSAVRSLGRGGSVEEFQVKKRFYFPLYLLRFLLFLIDSRITFIIWFLPVSDPEGRHRGVGGGIGGFFPPTLIWRRTGIRLGIFIRFLMAVGSSFDHWQKDVFFSAAEEVQESADAYALILILEFHVD